MANSSMANSFAYFALLIWPVVALYLYSRLPVGQATLWTILGGYLLLPVGLNIKFEMVPGFDKHSIPNLAALIGCAIYARPWPKFFRGFGLAEVLILLILFGPFVTSMLNTDAIRIGATVLPGVGAYDGGSIVVNGFINILPFFFGRQFLRSAEDNAQVLRVMVIAGLAYSLLVLLEIRMSPQVHPWIYGYLPDSFEFRDDTFRPRVFFSNGLGLSFFTMTTAVAAAALWRTKASIGRLPPGGITAYLSFVLVLCKAFGSIVYGAVSVPLVRWASPRFQLRVACIFVSIVLSYPILRAADVFPTSSLVEVAHVVSADRAASLNFRFEHEDQLLAHALERPWFGWGRFARNRVYNGENGADSSVTDGFWIIILGTFGVAGFVGTFGLLALAVFRAAMALKFAQTVGEREYLAALAIIIGISMIDQLPNATFSTWTWLLTGALLGRAEALRAATHQRVRLQDTSLPIGRPAS